jgi:hypothetical protein
MKMKSATAAVTKPIEPTTNSSPPTAPRAANPVVRRKRKAVPTSIAPQPMPNCLISTSPKRVISQCHWKPRSPMPKPWSRK